MLYGAVLEWGAALHAYSASKKKSSIDPDAREMTGAFRLVSLRVLRVLRGESVPLHAIPLTPRPRFQKNLRSTRTLE